jgi:hypothetical protein
MFSGSQRRFENSALLEGCELLGFFFGQVRDTYEAGDYLVLVTTDRQSAFDRPLQLRFVLWELAGSLVCFFPG